MPLLKRIRTTGEDGHCDQSAYGAVWPYLHDPFFAPPTHLCLQKQKKRCRPRCTAFGPGRITKHAPTGGRCAPSCGEDELWSPRWEDVRPSVEAFTRPG